VRVEDYNSDFIDRHFPTTDGGNIYQKGRRTNSGDQLLRHRRHLTACLMDGQSKTTARLMIGAI
jgi:hypothetical protein